MRQAAGGLLDEEDSALLADLVRAFDENQYPGVIRLHRLRAQRAGRFTHVDAHLIVPEYWTVERAHETTDAFADRVLAACRVDGEIIFHTDPCRRALCAICTVEGCPVRVEPFSGRPPLTLEEATATDETFWRDSIAGSSRRRRRCPRPPDRPCRLALTDARTMSRIIARLERAAPAWDTTALAAVARESGRDPVPRPRRVSPVAAHEGRDDGTGLGAPLRPRRHAGGDARAAAAHDRARDLPRRVLSHEGARAAPGVAAICSNASPAASPPTWMRC